MIIKKNPSVFTSSCMHIHRYVQSPAAISNTKNSVLSTAFSQNENTFQHYYATGWKNLTCLVWTQHLLFFASQVNGQVAMTIDAGTRWQRHASSRPNGNVSSFSFDQVFHQCLSIKIIAYTLGHLRMYVLSMYVSIYVSMHVCIYACIYAWMYACINVYMFVYMPWVSIQIVYIVPRYLIIVVNC